MKSRKIIILFSISVLLCLVCLSSGSYFKTDVTTFGNEILVKGKIGGDVYELQGRLQYLGFYKGKIDGIFGTGTYWAVRNFQYKFGMKVDGIVGAKTKLMLWKATKIGFLVEILLLKKQQQKLTLLINLVQMI